MIFSPLVGQDKATTPFRKQATLVAIDNYKNRFRSANISQSETALCSALVAQSGTDATVPSVPWPVPGHQRLDARQSPLGALQHAKKKDSILNVVCTSNSKSYVALRSVSLVAHGNL